MNLTHESCKEQLTDFMEGWLTKAESAEVQEHLNQCPSCQREYESYLQLTRELDGIPMAEPPLSLKSSIMAKIQAEPATIPAIRFLPWFSGMTLSYLSGLAILAATGYYLKNYWGNLHWTLPTPGEVISKSLIFGAKGIAETEQFCQLSLKIMLDLWPLLSPILTVNLILLLGMAIWFHYKKEKGYFGLFTV